MWWGERKIMWLEEWWTWMWKVGEEEVDQKVDGLTVWGRIWEIWLWVRKWRVIEKNGGRGHAAPTPNELGKGQEEEEDSSFILFNI
jgi:hypothetical protein